MLGGEEMEFAVGGGTFEELSSSSLHSFSPPSSKLQCQVADSQSLLRTKRSKSGREFTRVKISLSTAHRCAVLAIAACASLLAATACTPMADGARTERLARARLAYTAPQTPNATMVLMENTLNTSIRRNNALSLILHMTAARAAAWMRDRWPDAPCCDDSDDVLRS